MPDFPEDRRVAQLAERLHRLEGLFASVRDNLQTLEGQVSIAKGRLALRPEIERLLDALAHRAHERSVGHYEHLLSAIVKDVLPEGGQRVHLTLETRRDLPALSFSVTREAADGLGEDLEDILDGNGGSLTNVVVAGLRYIALARSGHRPFVILDEPDCWLPPGRIPAFAGVIGQLARGRGGEQGGIQTLLISHHDAALFEMGYIVHLTRNGTNGVTASCPQGEVHDFPPGHPGVRRIRLINCRAHEDTVIPLSPGVTLLTGDSNVGKSAVVGALRAVAYGEGSDDLIRHGCAQASVEIDFADGERLTFERRRKGNPRTLYRLTDASGAVLHEGGAGREVPDWASAKLGIARVDGLDVQISNQKKPVFLLDEPDTKRAAILSVGRESGILDRLRRVWKRQIDDDRRTVREGEEAIARLRATLAAFSGTLEDAGNRVAGLRQAREALDQERLRLSAAEALSRRLDEGERLSRHSDRIRASASALTRTPALALTDEAARRAERLERLATETAQMHRARAIAVPEVPSAHPTDDAAGLCERIGRLAADIEARLPVRTIILPDPPALAPTDEGARRAERFVRTGAECAALARAREIALPDTPAIRESGQRLAIGRRLHTGRLLLEALRKAATLSLPPVPNPSPVAPRLARAEAIETLDRRLAADHKDRQEAALALRVVREEERALERELGVCPLCGAEFHPSSGEGDAPVHAPHPASPARNEDPWEPLQEDLSYATRSAP